MFNSYRILKCVVIPLQTPYKYIYYTYTKVCTLMYFKMLFVFEYFKCNFSFLKHCNTHNIYLVRTICPTLPEPVCHCQSKSTSSFLELFVSSCTFFFYLLMKISHIFCRRVCVVFCLRFPRIILVFT